MRRRARGGPLEKKRDKRAARGEWPLVPVTSGTLEPQRFPSSLGVYYRAGIELEQLLSSRGFDRSNETRTTTLPIHIPRILWIISYRIQPSIVPPRIIQTLVPEALSGKWTCYGAGCIASVIPLRDCSWSIVPTGTVIGCVEYFGAAPFILSRHGSWENL